MVSGSEGYFVHCSDVLQVSFKPLQTLLRQTQAGLPDGIFSNQKSQCGKFWRALERKILVYFMAIWNILRPFVIFYDLLTI
jgi:hypothetical protein